MSLLYLHEHPELSESIAQEIAKHQEELHIPAATGTASNGVIIGNGIPKSSRLGAIAAERNL
ncbi:MAG: hypothetical protein EBE86_005165 [Hormoscilla sp. GUM202]|nr:hypothetical protein [Hormoscilla sp. GUM202]